MSRAASRLLILLAALDGFAAVAGGAFGAHGVHDETARALLRTGAEYQLAASATGLALLAQRDLSGARLAAALVLAGGLVFGLSLDGIVVTGVRMLGAVTPVGGLLMLAGFAWLGVSALRNGGGKAS
jgi:uncharacterized membrane protein YgdD (TMEM256/DUF423 family)